jgi:hypothetical protein
MNILYTFFNYNGYTGSELYYYELSREMIKLGHKVTIASNCGGELTDRSRAYGVNCINFNEIKGFSQFDIIHASHKPVLQGLALHKLKQPIIATVHSELLDIEKVQDTHENMISHFIGIRPGIYEDLPKGKRSLVYNPFDFDRFNTEGCSNRNDLIFVPGTINYLRANMIVDLALTYGDHYNVLAMGANDYAQSKISNIIYADPAFEVEEIIKKSFAVAGIIKGRTYIEAMLCGKNYIDYKVDKEGVLQDINMITPMDLVDFGDGLKLPLSIFDSRKVALEIESIYKSFLG